MGVPMGTVPAVAGISMLMTPGATPALTEPPVKLWRAV